MPFNSCADKFETKAKRRANYALKAEHPSESVVVSKLDSRAENKVILSFQKCAAAPTQVPHRVILERRARLNEAIVVDHSGSGQTEAHVERSNNAVIRAFQTCPKKKKKENAGWEGDGMRAFAAEEFRLVSKRDEKLAVLCRRK